MLAHVDDDVLDLIVPEKVQYEGEEYPVCRIDPDAIGNDPNLCSVSIPDSVTELSEKGRSGKRPEIDRNGSVPWLCLPGNGPDPAYGRTYRPVCLRILYCAGRSNSFPELQCADGPSVLRLQEPSEHRTT